MSDGCETTDVSDGGPQVFVVDSKAMTVPFRRPVAMKLDGHHLSLIYLLLCVALLGVFIEAGLIYHLYNRHTVPSDHGLQKVEYIKQAEKDSVQNEPQENNIIMSGEIPDNKSKPAAFLQKENSGFRWTKRFFPTFVNSLELLNNSLYIQEAGYYYIFSKISFLDNCSFVKHQVMYMTMRYSKPLELMKSSRYLCHNHKGQSRPEQGNSYLGGIFNLVKGDCVFVQINNHSLVYGEASENFFGAFKIY